MIAARKPVGTVASECGALAQGEDVGRGVDDGVGVGHREDAAVAAGGRGAGAGLDLLLVLAARRAQVDVGVEEGGEREQAVGVDDLGVLDLGAAGIGELGDLAVADHEVTDGADSGARADDLGAAQHDGARLGAAP